jgi:hypothetical protein
MVTYHGVEPDRREGMRRLFVGLVVAAVTVLIPTWALAGNQEVAERIASNLRQGGELQGYKIGVKYQDGTAWLRGRVSSQAQMNAAMKLVFQTPGVNRVVNDLTIASDEEAAPAQVPSVVQPEGVLRVATSFDPRPAQPVAATALQEPTLAPPQPQILAQAPVPAPPVVAVRPTAPQPVPTAVVQGGVPMPMGQAGAVPMPQYVRPVGTGVAPVRYDQPHLPSYAWPSYAAYPNYAGLTYPKQYSPTAWPYIGPFYPYPQVPLGWRKVTLEWHDGWWQLDFDDGPRKGCFSGLFRHCK